MKLTLVFCEILLIALAAFAQTGERPALFTVTGRVIDADGKPIAEARVQAQPELLTGRPPTAVTDVDGRFSFGAYKGGPWVVLIDKPGDGYPGTYHSFYYPDKEYRPEFILEDGRNAPFLSIRLPDSMGTVKVQLANEYKSKVAVPVRFRLCRVDGPYYCYTIDRPASAFPIQILAPSFPFRITAYAEGYADWSQLIENGVGSGLTVELSLKLQKRTDAKNRLTAPEVIAPKDGAEIFQIPRNIQLMWQTVPGAVSYELEIDACDLDGGKQPYCRVAYPLQHYRNRPTSGIVETKFEFGFIGAQPGRWRVWAVDSEGRSGEKSDWQTFFSKY